jgi:hypothetical protein
MTVREQNAQPDTRGATLGTFLVLFVAAFIAGIFFAGAFFATQDDGFDPVEVWCDGAYDYNFRAEASEAAEINFMASCTEDMADGRSDLAPTFDIVGFEDES